MIKCDKCGEDVTNKVYNKSVTIEVNPKIICWDCFYDAIKDNDRKLQTAKSIFQFEYHAIEPTIIESGILDIYIHEYLGEKNI